MALWLISQMSQKLNVKLLRIHQLNQKCQNLLQSPVDFKVMFCAVNSTKHFNILMFE